jgi:hypothetical protein
LFGKFLSLQPKGQLQNQHNHTYIKWRKDKEHKARVKQNTVINDKIQIFSTTRQPSWATASSLSKFWDHTKTHTHTHTIGRTPLEEWSASRRDLYLTTRSIHKRHPCPGRIRTHTPSKWAAAVPRLKQRRHWHRQIRITQKIQELYELIIIIIIIIIPNMQKCPN